MCPWCLTTRHGGPDRRTWGVEWRARPAWRVGPGCGRGPSEPAGRRGERVVGEGARAHRMSQPGLLAALRRVGRRSSVRDQVDGAAPSRCATTSRTAQARAIVASAGSTTSGIPSGRGASCGLGVPRGHRDVVGIDHALVRVDAPQARGHPGYDERADHGTPVHQAYDDMAGASPEQRVESFPGELADPERDHRVRLVQLGGRVDTGGPEQLVDRGQTGAGDPAEHGDLPPGQAPTRGPRTRQPCRSSCSSTRAVRGTVVEWSSLEEERERPQHHVGARQHDPAAVVQPDLDAVEPAPDHAESGSELGPR